MTMPTNERGTARLSELIPLPSNAKTRRLKKTARDALGASIERFGVVQEIVVNRQTGHIVGGHQRVEWLASRGVVEVPVVWVDLDATDELALALALNNPGAQGEFTSHVDEVVAEITRQRPDVARVLRLSALRTSKAKARAGARIAGDQQSRRALEPISKEGEVYELGPHRLLCGDSTKRDQVVAFLNGLRPSLLFTDPPYGVIYGKGSNANNANAIRGDLSQAEIPISFAVCIEVLDDDARLYLCGGTLNGQLYTKLFDHYLQQMPHEIVWVKERFILRPNGYHNRYEKIYWGWKGKGGGPGFWYGDRTIDDVWEVPRDPEDERVHPTQKPVELPARAIRNHLAPGAVVFEPFAGSGSTLIAAAEEGRVCYAIDTDPHFCDVIRRRWTAWAIENKADLGSGALE